jgi:beta-glucanase (GH16 family)
MKEIVWQDTFEKVGSPNLENWRFDLGGGGWGNNELQCYTDRLNNAYISDNTLKIKAVEEKVADCSFSSARLVSKKAFLYGDFRIIAKCPTSLGTWAAVWMLPENFEHYGWPDGGEIDIMEYLGFQHDSVISTVHTKCHNHLCGTQKGTEIKVPDLSNKFHEFRLLWQKDCLEWFIDGISKFVLTKDELKDWPFDKPFNLILNLAIGGNLGGLLGIAEDGWPQIFEIESVKVFKIKK